MCNTCIYTIHTYITEVCVHVHVCTQNTKAHETKFKQSMNLDKEYMGFLILVLKIFL